MSFSKLFLLVTPMLAYTANAVAIPTPESFVPLVPQGNVATVTNPAVDGDRRLYYQDSTGEITEYAFKGFFGNGNSFGSPAQHVPPSEVLPGSPISAIWKPNEIHVYFFSPSRVLSEYYLTVSTNTWRGGSGCTNCVTQNGFVVDSGTTELYSTFNSSGTIAVGHISAGIPGTISEAVQNSAGTYSLNSLS